jgi:hypothetical protein
MWKGVQKFLTWSKMMHFVEFSMKLPKKIRGNNSLLEVLDLLFVWTQNMRR